MALTVSPNHSVDKNPFIYAAYRRIAEHQWTSMDPASLPDAEPPEDHAQQVVGCAGAGDFTQGVVGQAQFLGQQFQGGIAQLGALAGFVQVTAGAAQGLDVALAGDAHALRCGVPAGQLQQAPAQAFQAVVGAGGQDHLVARSVAGAVRASGQALRRCGGGVGLVVTVHDVGARRQLGFGGCTASKEKCLPITKGWNYAVRMYEPGKAIADGRWKFPGPPIPRAKCRTSPTTP